MDKLKTLTANALKNRQTRLFLLAVAGLMLTIFGLVWLSSSGDKPIETEPTAVTKISTATADIDNESIWIQKSESLFEELQERDKDQTNQIEELKSLIQSQQDSETEWRQNQQEQFNQFLEQSQSSKSQELSGTDIPAHEFDASRVAAAEVVEATPIGISKGSLDLLSQEEEVNPKNITNTVPAGSHVKAVILGGVDASASVSAQSDPKPVLLRLTDQSVLPNEFRSDLKDCHLTAAAFGDISSERALMRLETISCVNQKGEILEAQVAGYVAGEDGVTGVRGQVVYRERELLNHSLMSGILSGIGKGIESQFTTVAKSPLGATSTVAGDQVLKSGMASGASDALDQYAKYHIERAEQYQPTIQIGAGRKVDVVFTKGWALKEIKSKKETPHG